MSEVNPYESPSISSSEPPLPTKTRPAFWTSVLQSGKYWTILLGTALVGFCVILWCANVIVPYLTKVLTGRGTPQEVETSRAIDGTVQLLGFGIPISFVIGAMIGCVKHFAGSSAEKK